MIHSGRLTIAAANTPQPFTVSREMAGWVTIHANATNGGYVYVGGTNTVNNGGGTKNYIGHPLAPGDWVSFRELGGPAYVDLHYVYAAADGNGYKITYTYGEP